MSTVEHQPAQFLVIEPDWPGGPVEFRDSGPAVAYAQARAKDMPGQFIDIYQHAAAVRHSPEVAG